MYEYRVNVDGNNSITYVFMKDTYFPIEEFEEMCKGYLTRYGVETGLSMLEFVLVALGFELFDIIGESSLFYNIHEITDNINITFNFKNVVSL